ncbi:hypothetical protein ACFVH7_12390 [Kitasatospora indigofera]|uniref:hypothetical protein n=1 Tax=Kitasatospora indigofera TaxID=67307 RepID=UPI0036318C33
MPSQPVRPPGPLASRLRAHADAIDDLSSALPGAYREQGLPTYAELLPHLREIGARHQALFSAAAVLAGAALAGTAQRSAALALPIAGAQVGAALEAVGRAATMASRIHAVQGMDGHHADQERELAARTLNLSLSRTRIALADASDHLRHSARSARHPAAMPVPARRNAAATARTYAPTTHVVASAGPPASVPLAPARPAHGR